MRAEVMEYYGLTRSPRALGYYETAHHRQLLQDIKQAAYDADLVALCGVVGAGKTVTLHRLQEVLARENRVIVSKAVAIEKSRITLNGLVTALFCDLSPDKRLAIPKNTELRDRALADLVRKRRKPIVLIVDEPSAAIPPAAQAEPLAAPPMTCVRRSSASSVSSRPRLKERASFPCCWPATPSCDLRPDEADVGRQIAFWQENGLVSKNADFKNLFDLSLLPAKPF